MARKHYDDELRRRVVREVEDGASVDEVVRRYGIAEATYYRWRARYVDATPGGDPLRHRIEEENRRLRDLYAEAALELQVLRQQIKRLQRSGLS